MGAGGCWNSRGGAWRLASQGLSANGRLVKTCKIGVALLYRIAILSKPLTHTLYIGA